MVQPPTTAPSVLALAPAALATVSASLALTPALAYTALPPVEESDLPTAADVLTPPVAASVLTPTATALVPTQSPIASSPPSPLPSNSALAESPSSPVQDSFLSIAPPLSSSPSPAPFHSSHPESPSTPAQVPPISAAPSPRRPIAPNPRPISDAAAAAGAAAISRANQTPPAHPCPLPFHLPPSPVPPSSSSPLATRRPSHTPPLPLSAITHHPPATSDLDSLSNTQHDPLCCPICLNPFGTEPPFWTPCAHSFHFTCITTWFTIGHSSCPSCRGDCSPAPLRFGIQPIIDSDSDDNEEFSEPFYIPLIPSPSSLPTPPSPREDLAPLLLPTPPSPSSIPSLSSSSLGIHSALGAYTPPDPTSPVPAPSPLLLTPPATPPSTSRADNARWWRSAPPPLQATSPAQASPPHRATSSLQAVHPLQAVPLQQAVHSRKRTRTVPEDQQPWWAVSLPSTSLSEMSPRSTRKSARLNISGNTSRDHTRGEHE